MRRRGFLVGGGLGVAILAGTIGSFAILGHARAQSSDTDNAKKAEDGLPLKPTRKISFTTDEGTWISLDVSPDGRQIVFDLLGDLYLLPIEGGEAKHLTTGLPYDCQPRFSPDGRQVAFISDRSGSDNVWVINTDGSGAKAISKETSYEVGSPTWAPAGDYILARRWGPYPGPETYFFATQLWMYHKDGGSGFEARRGVQINGGPAFSPDGKKVYFSSGTTDYSGRGDIGTYQIHVLDRETGLEDALTSEYGGGLRPIMSSNGQYLVYATRQDGKTALKIRDLKTNEQHWLVAEAQRDDREDGGADDAFPGYAFTPDSKSVVYAAGGHIHRVDVATHQVTTIPFTAKVELELGPRVHVDYKTDDGPLVVRQLRWVNQSPQGRIVFGAVGKIWVADASGGSPHRLTSSSLHEYQPTFSPDGRSIAYVSWSDSEGGAIWKAPTDGGAPIKLNQAPAYFAQPSWSPKGDKIVYETSSWPSYLSGTSIGPAEFRWIGSDGGPSHLVLTASPAASMPMFNNDGSRVFYMDSESTPSPAGLSASFFVLRSVRLDGLDQKTHLRFDAHYVSVTAVPSPDENWVLVNDRYDAYLAPFPKPEANTAVYINLKSGTIPVKRLTKTGANYPHWADDGKTITWSFSNEFHRAKLDEVWKAEKDDAWKVENVGVNLQVPRVLPQGAVLLQNARLITMKGQEVIERGDVLFENNRIKEVGPAGSVRGTASAKVIDLRGKTIIPGLVDIHAHLGVAHDILKDQEWPYAATLAYGVTTTRDPSIESNGVFAAGELVESGDLIGPRIYATGTAMTTDAVSIDSYEDAENIVKRYKEHGANSLKQYMQTRRTQREWLAMAAAKEGINITAEGARDFKLDMSMILDGYTGVEHSLPANPIFRDVMEFEARAGTTYTPTLTVSLGGVYGQYYWRQRMNLHEDEKIRRFTPHEEIDRKSRRLILAPDDEYTFRGIATGLAGIVARGGHVALGSHGEQQGIEAQWELWMMQSGGMTPWQALWCATMNGAESIGYDKELGSIEPGKLADLVVLNANPLENIQNTNKIQYVIKNGVIYNADTLDDVWPSEKKFPPFIWNRTDAELKALPH